MMVLLIDTVCECNCLGHVSHTDVQIARQQPERVELTSTSRAKVQQRDLTIHSSVAPVHTELVAERLHTRPGISCLADVITVWYICIAWYVLLPSIHVSHACIFVKGSSWFSSQRLPRRVLHYVVREFGTCNNKGTSVWTLSQALDLANFSAFWPWPVSCHKCGQLTSTVASLLHWMLTFVYNTLFMIQCYTVRLQTFVCADWHAQLLSCW